jgi:hypothetical protein
MRRSVLALTVMALVAAACGGSGEEAGSDTAPSAAPTTAATVAPTSTDAPDSDDQNVGSDDDEQMTGDNGSEWCDGVRAGAEEASPLEFNLLGLSPEQIEVRLTGNVALLEDWHAQAPPEIEDDVGILVDAFRTMVELAEEAEWDLVALGSDPAFAETFEDDDLERATDRIDAYSRDVCGVDLRASDPGQGTPPTLPTGGDDAASQMLALFGIPSDVLPSDQVDCLNDELAAAFPDGLPEDLVLTEEIATLFDEIASTCELGAP